MPHLHYYQIGGSLPYNADSYVMRPADDELYRYLKAGKFCYVLTARQLGKSSLRVRAMRELEKLGFRTVYIDMTQFGSRSFAPDQWYYSLIVYISESLDLLAEFDAWEEQFISKNITPISLLSLYMRNFLLPRLEKRLIIFMDEIDALLSLDRDQFDTDDFFAVIRSFYNERADNPDFNKINFALFGVAHPNDLMKDVTRTPFNIGEAISLDNFQFEEAKDALISGLSHLEANPELLLKEIFKQTNGQPYLTQKLCAKIAEDTSPIKDERSFVYKHVNQLFFNDAHDKVDPNLANINNRLIKNKAYNLKMLQLYRRILAGEKIEPDQTDFTQIYLKLSGLVIEHSGRLVINNRIYRHYFSHDWIDNVLDKLDRPYTKDLQRWMEKGKNDPATALRGDLLKEALEWKKEREDLSREEQEFFEFSQLVEIVEENKATRAEYSQKLNRRIRAQRNVLILLNVFIFLFIFTAINSYLLIEKNKELTLKTSQLSQQADSLNSQRETLEKQNQKLEQEINVKEQRNLTLRQESRVIQDSLSNSRKESQSWRDSLSRSRLEQLNIRRQYELQKKQLLRDVETQENEFYKTQAELSSLKQNSLELITQFEQQIAFLSDFFIEESKISLMNQTNASFLLNDSQESKLRNLKQIRVILKLKKGTEKLPDIWLKLEKKSGNASVIHIDRVLPANEQAEINQSIKADYLKPGHYTLRLVLLYKDKELDLRNYKFQLE